MATKKYVSLEKLGLYDGKIKKVITDADGVVLQSAKDYADGLADNYDAAGSAATAEANAKAYADGKDAAIAEAKKAGTDAQAAAEVADGKAVAAQTDVDNLETYVGTFTASEGVDTVVKYIDAKTKNIASDETVNALADRVTQAETDIDNIEKDYLKKADKEELAGDIADVQTALDEEIARADAAEKANAAAIKAITDDYLTSTDKESLEASIKSNTDAIELLTDGVDTEKVDGVKDLIAYVEEHGTEVTGMKEDIADNAEAISGVAGRMTTAEGKITAVEGAVATKAEKTYVDEVVETLQGEDTDIKGRLDVIEGQLGDAGDIAQDIATAKQEAIDAAATDATTKANAAESNAKGYTDSEIDKVEVTIATMQTAIDGKATSADLTTLAGRVTVNEGDIATLKTDVDAVEKTASDNASAISALQTASATHAKQSDLEAAVARISANETAIASFVEVSEEEINALFQN